MTADGTKIQTYVRAAGEVIAWQRGSGGSGDVLFQQTDPSGMSNKASSSSGTVHTDEGWEGASSELDPMGGNAGQRSPYIGAYAEDPCPGCGQLGQERPERVNGGSVEYQIDGMSMPRSTFHSATRSIGLGSVETFMSLASLLGWSSQQIGWRANYKMDGDDYSRFYRMDQVGSVFEQILEGSQISPIYAMVGWSVSHLITWGPQQQQRNTGPKLDPKLPSNIRQLVSDLAKRKDCADILDKFAKELGKKDNLDEIGEGKSFIESVFDNLDKIEINPKKAGSGARTDGDNIWLHDYSHLNKAHQNALYTKYIIQELVHNFKNGNGNFSDSKLAGAAEKVLTSMDPTAAQKIRDGFKATGYKPEDMLHHYLINQFCQYTQQEVDSGQPQ